MPRYIDADALMEDLRIVKPITETEAVAFRFAYCKVKDAPTADVVEVVRCKDCKHRILDHGIYICDLDSWDKHERSRNTDNGTWFCADGEMK